MTTTAEISRKTYRCNAKCKKCGDFVSRAFHKVGKVDAGRTRLEDCSTGELVIGHNVSKMTGGGAVVGRWQVTHRCNCGADFTLMPAGPWAPGSFTGDHMPEPTKPPTTRRTSLGDTTLLHLRLTTPQADWLRFTAKRESISIASVVRSLIDAARKAQP